MSRGNDRLRSFGTKALLLGFLLGSFTALESRFQTLRLFSLTLSPWNTAIENQLFRQMPSSAQRFWPLSVTSFRPCQKSIEELFPVKVTPSLSGWGKARFSYVPLEVFLHVKWKGEEWALSPEGKIWLCSHNLEAQEKGKDIPFLKWGDNLPSLFPDGGSRIVHDSNLPIVKIKQWFDGISESTWSQNPIRIDVRERTGDLILELHRKFGTTEIKLILPEDTTRWPQIFQALKKIRKRLNGQEKWVQIDTTYDDKIVVKRDIL